MPTAVTMQGLLEPVEIEETFTDVVNSLNVASAKGMDFIIARDTDGDPVAFHSKNILVLRELIDSPDAFRA